MSARKEFLLVCQALEVCTETIWTVGDTSWVHILKLWMIC